MNLAQVDHNVQREHRKYQFIKEMSTVNYNTQWTSSRTLRNGDHRIGLWDQAETQVTLILHPNLEMSSFPDLALLNHFLNCLHATLDTHGTHAKVTVAASTIPVSG